MRTRIITSPSFGGNRILAAILFEDTMNREIDGVGATQYLWEQKQVVPILKVDKGLEDEADGVQLMKPMPELDELLERAKANGVFGTKMRSSIKLANAAGIQSIVDQQFEIGLRIVAAGLVPIMEPEVDIHSPDKSEAEVLLKVAIRERLGMLSAEQQVMFKLTLPEDDGQYSEVVHHPNVVRVVALSGGYSRAEANERLAKCHGIVASFSRALTEGLTAQHSEDEFNSVLDEFIESIFQASKT